MSALMEPARPGDEGSFQRVLMAARAGGDWAWRELYHLVAPDLLRYLRARGAADAEDLVGDTFVLVVRHLERFVGDAADFRAWVFTIARNVAVDASRKRARRPEELREDLHTVGPTGDTEADAMVPLGTAQVLRTLGVLSEDQRDVVLLRVLADLSFAEIGQVLGKREGTVRVTHTRALAALRTKISRGDVTL